MRHNMDSPNTAGVSICVPVPAKGPELYGKKASDAILLFLSRHRYDRFAQRELARQVEYPESTVRRTVDVLAENELVTHEYDGNRKLVGINRERLSFPDDPVLRISQEEFQKPVGEAVETITTRLESIVGVILYGSVARGEADRRSDIDLWVAVQEDRAANQREANAIEKDLEDREFRGERYDFHIAVESIDSIPAFRENIEHIVLSGIPVYTTDDFEKLRTALAHGNYDE